MIAEQLQNRILLPWTCGRADTPWMKMPAVWQLIMMFSEITILFSGFVSSMIAPALKCAKEHSCIVVSLLSERTPAVKDSYSVSPLKLQWKISKLVFGCETIHGTFRCVSLVHPSSDRIQLFILSMPLLTMMMVYIFSFT